MIAATSMTGWIAGCHDSRPVPQRTHPGEVAWVGTLHQAVHDGDVAAKIRLQDLVGRPHLHALGPLEDLRGEITVIDGRCTIASVDRGQFRTEQSAEHGAAFLVWAYGDCWDSKRLPESVRTLEQLESFIPDAARAAGLDSAAPLVFRVEGTVEQLRFHVLSPPGESAPSYVSHEQSKVRGAVTDRRVWMVGFFSSDHRGVFTPATSDLHVHFVTDDHTLSGHVEEFTLGPGAELLLPASRP